MLSRFWRWLFFTNGIDPNELLRFKDENGWHHIHRRSIVDIVDRGDNQCNLHLANGEVIYLDSNVSPVYSVLNQIYGIK
jgi:hypothetical protein